MLFHQSAAEAINNHGFSFKTLLKQSNKRVIVTLFTMKIKRTYLYINCNTKILFVKKYLSLRVFWVLANFSILLVAVMITDDDDDDMMIEQ